MALNIQFLLFVDCVYVLYSWKFSRDKTFNVSHFIHEKLERHNHQKSVPQEFPVIWYIPTYNFEVVLKPLLLVALEFSFQSLVYDHPS